MNSINLLKSIKYINVVIIMMICYNTTFQNFLDYTILYYTILCRNKNYFNNNKNKER